MSLLKTNAVKTTNGISGRNENQHEAPDNMEAIARGVQVRLDERTSFSRKVTDETVNTARALGVSNTIIERWAAERLNRLAQERERLREIRALVDRCYRDKPNIATKTRA
jgi:hypothetical protein